MINFTYKFNEYRNYDNHTIGNENCSLVIA
jgi:hypothetical protein